MPEDLESQYAECLKRAVKLCEQKRWEDLNEQLELLEKIVEKFVEREKRKRGDK
jgi:hypothetical protein